MMKLLRIIKQIIVSVIEYIYRYIFKYIPIDDKLVIFISFHGRGYSDNPRAIYEEMIKDEYFKDYKFIWFIKNHKNKNIDIPKAKIVEYCSIPYFYYMSKAKYWVINCKMPTYFSKKKNQVYLQTWHGTPLKRLGHDIEMAEDMTFYRSGMSYKKMCETYSIDSARYNYMISPNSFCSEIFPRAFDVNKDKMIETGYPRNDFITNATSEDVINIKKKLSLPLDKKIILYAPTWRDNSYVASGYTFELEADFNKWKEILGDDYIVVFKPHYLIINKYENDHSLDGFLYSMKAEAEINELYVISDLLITDYSSVFFDYSVLNRPIYFYMYDLESYKDELRGFYLDIYKDLPGTIYEDEQTMLSDIHNHIYDYEFLKQFNQRFNHAQLGDSSKKVIDIVFNKV